MDRSPDEGAGAAGMVPPAGGEPGAAARPRRGIPTARNVDHVGVTVPDLEAAIRFFVDVLGCDLLYRSGPFADPEGDGMERGLAVDRRAVLDLALLRCGPNLNVELLRFATPEPAAPPPRNSDPGAAHLAFAVDDLEAAMAYLAGQPGVTLLAGPNTVPFGPSAGLRYVYFTAPWGLTLELVAVPTALPYKRDTDARAYGPAPAWDVAPPDHGERGPTPG